MEATLKTAGNILASTACGCQAILCNLLQCVYQIPSALDSEQQVHIALRHDLLSVGAQYQDACNGAIGGLLLNGSLVATVSLRDF